jgi:hypothetical protein
MAAARSSKIAFRSHIQKPLDVAIVGNVRGNSLVVISLTCNVASEMYSPCVAFLKAGSRILKGCAKPGKTLTPARAPNSGGNGAPLVRLNGTHVRVSGTTNERKGIALVRLLPLLTNTPVKWNRSNRNLPRVYGHTGILKGDGH